MKQKFAKLIDVKSIVTDGSVLRVGTSPHDNCRTVHHGVYCGDIVLFRHAVSEKL